MKILLIVLLTFYSIAGLTSQGGTGIQSNSFMRVGSINGCIGTLIEDDVVITAAHCVNGANDFVFHFYLLKGSRGADYIPIDRIVVHPRYNEEKMKTYDLAIVFLKRSPETYDSLLDRRESIDLGPRFEITDSLFSNMILVSKKTYGSEGTAPWTKTNIKLKNFKKNKPVNSYRAFKGSKVCPGDSGAPIFSENKFGKYSLHAIVSGGKETFSYSIKRNYRTLMNHWGKTPRCNDVTDNFFAIPLARHQEWIHNTIKNY